LARIRNHLRHHGRFYAAAAIGAAVYGALSLWSGLPAAPRILAGGDAFFAIYLGAVVIGIAGLTPKDLRAKAAIEDEGIALVMLIALAVIGVSSAAILTVLRQKHGADPLPLALAIAGIPLGWFTLNTLVAFHYAYIYYGKRGARAEGGLEFPGTPEPGVWEFLYYSFTIGTTAQTSDTNIHSTRMRRATLIHSVLSFFYYTAIIAMAVNAVVAMAS
jgi:uncharacterized membrane protein